MKKILLFICLAVASSASFAQSDKSVTFGVKGGVNFARMPYTGMAPTVSISASSATNFHVGAFVNFKVCESVSVQPALLYTGKGGKHVGVSFNETVAYSYHTKSNIYYLQLPVNIIYHLPVGEHSFFVGAGPFLSYGLSGRVTGTGTLEAGGEITTDKIDDKVTFGNSDPDTFRRWDYGAGALAGFKFNNGFLVNLNYDLGLANVIPDFDGNDLKAKTRVFGISVGYAF